MNRARLSLAHHRSLVFGLTAALVATLSVGSHGLPADDEIAARFKDRASFDRFVKEGWDSPFGIDYVFVHSAGARDSELIDRVCSQVAIRWVNLTRLEWKVIERQAPLGGRHRYDWSDLDRAVRAWQAAGIHIMITMRFESPWATAARSDRNFVYLQGFARKLAIAGADYLPKPEHLSDLRDYVRNLVERYDGDGHADMPGLLFPVLHYQVGNEYSNEVFWTGTAAEYGELLREVARSARAACPQVKIILSGVGFKDVYGYYDVEIDPRTRAYLQRYLPRVPSNMLPFVRRTELFSLESMRLVDAYDILDARWPNYGIVNKCRDAARDAGAHDKEIWSAEIYSGFPLMERLVLPNWTLQAWPTPPRSVEYARILKSPKHEMFEPVNSWYRGMQAAQVVKICMVALDAGSRKLMMGWAVDMQNPLAVSTLSHHGLYSATLHHLWPAAHAYNQVITRLEKLQQIERLQMSDGVFVYRCVVQGGRNVLIGFCDDHIAQNHDQPTAKIETHIPLRSKSTDHSRHLANRSDPTASLASRSAEWSPINTINGTSSVY